MEPQRQVGEARGWYTLKRIALLSVFMIPGSDSREAVSPSVARASNDPYITVTVRAAEVVFVGSVLRLLDSDCMASGLAASRQGISFRVKEVLKGHIDTRGEFTAYHSLMGDGPLEKVADRCVQLAPEIFVVGREFIVACKHEESILPKGGWVITGGPWLAERDTERVVSKAIANGDVGRPQEIWLRYEIDLERFVAGEEVPSSKIQRAIEFFDRLTGSESTENDKGIEQISKSSLKNDLDVWKAWYQQHGDTLSWDAKRLMVIVNEATIPKKEP